MAGWVTVSSEALAQEDDLLAWLERGRDFAVTLPAKE
jgi:hypothetical protein